MSTEKELQESLDAARSWQEKRLPSFDYIVGLIPESFIIYLPKEKVSGDFYWVEAVNEEVLFAVADCTGHGVAGAMLTVKCFDLLNSALKDYGCIMPGHILDKVLELLIHDFKNRGNEIKEGMDIALCSINGNVLRYSGANNPLWICRNGLVIEMPATRQGIGLTDVPMPFFTHEMNIESGDVLFLFSDGFQDQFGGPGNKKYKVRNFKRFVQKISKENLIRQEELLSKEISTWKANEEQNDDITIMAIKIQ